MSGGHGGKKGHKQHEEHEEHEEHVNHEAWVIPYADMLTLLMALFLVLFAIGRTDLEKFKKLAESFRQEFGGSGASSQVVTISEGSGGESPLDGGEGVLDTNSLPSSAEGASATSPERAASTMSTSESMERPYGDGSQSMTDKKQKYLAPRWLRATSAAARQASVRTRTVSSTPGSTTDSSSASPRTSPSSSTNVVSSS